MNGYPIATFKWVRVGYIIIFHSKGHTVGSNNYLITSVLQSYGLTAGHLSHVLNHDTSHVIIPVRWETYPSGSAIKAYNLNITPASQGDEICIKSAAAACEFSSCLRRPVGNCETWKICLGAVLLASIIPTMPPSISCVDIMPRFNPSARSWHGGFLPTNAVCPRSDDIPPLVGAYRSLISLLTFLLGSS